ncbi:Signal transduction histidine-protein kinase BarA [subsurface metagenome]
MKNSANRLLALINDIIDISKIEAGKVEIAVEEFDLPLLAQEIKYSFAVAVDKKELKLLLQTPPTLIIKTDKRRTEQVLVNFVSNAVKFTDKGEIEIKIVKKDKTAEISVRDTGVTSPKR